MRELQNSAPASLMWVSTEWEFGLGSYYRAVRPPLPSRQLKWHAVLRHTPLQPTRCGLQVMTSRGRIPVITEGVRSRSLVCPGVRIRMSTRLADE